MSQYNNLEKLQCVSRELAMRRRVYARRVEAGAMAAAHAQREIALMEEIVADYDALVLKDIPKLPLAGAR